jgi:hypothetical protein
MLPPLTALDEHLEQWVAEGLITETQAARITAVEEQPPPVETAPGHRTSLMTEALGYVGGVLVVVASTLLTAQFWSGMPVGLRLSLTGAAAALLLAVGAALPARSGTAAERLRAAAWLLSSAAFAFLIGLFSVEVLGWHDADAALLISAATALYASLLWLRLRSYLQQGVLFVALAATAAATLAEVAPAGPSGDGLPALGILVVGAVWLYLGFRNLLAPRRFVLVLGGLGAVVGASTAQMTDWGRVLGVLTVLGLVALALRVSDFALLAVGALGMFIVFPQVLMNWFPGAVAAPVALLLAGSLLVLAALRTMRHDDSRRS